MGSQYDRQYNKKIESLQRRATKFILNTHWQEDISYHERLSRLNLLPLTYWHEVKDLIFYFRAPNENIYSSKPLKHLNVF